MDKVVFTRKFTGYQSLPKTLWTYSNVFDTVWPNNKN